MAGIADMLVASGLEESTKAPDIAGNLNKGAELALAMEKMQQARAEIEANKKKLMFDKIDKYTELFSTAAKLEPKAQKIILHDIAPKVRQAYGLESIFPDDTTKILMAEPGLVSYLKSAVDNKKFTFEELSQRMQDPVWVAKQIPEVYREQALAELPETMAGYGSDIQKQETKRLEREAAMQRTEYIARASAAKQAKEIAATGQKEVAKGVGKEYTDYVAAGGKSGLESSIARLENAAEALETGKVKTGGVSTTIPGFKSDAVQSMINPKLVEMRTEAQAALNNVLRQTLGAQFTEQEGVRVLNQVWSDMATPDVNAKKIRKKISELRANIINKESAFRKQGFDVPITLPSGVREKASKLGPEAKSKLAEQLSKTLNAPAADILKELGD